MPLYEYECEKCTEVFETRASIADYQKKQPCPLCGEESPRILSNVNIGAFSALSAEGQHEALRRRSVDHTKSTVAKEGIPQFNRNPKDKWKGVVTTSTPDKK